MLRLLALNSLGPVDIAFFIVCAVIIVAAVGIYFLIPVINKKQYQEQRENLKRREVSFKANQGIATEEAQTETEPQEATQKAE